MTNIQFTSDITHAINMLPDINNNLAYTERNTDEIRKSIKQINKELHMQTIIQLYKTRAITRGTLEKELKKYTEVE